MSTTNENTPTYLPGHHPRARLMRIDSASIFKRLYLLERCLIISQAGWLPGIASFRAKTTLPRHIWQDTQVADDLRERVFELRYPKRMLEIDDDAPLVEIFQQASHAPNPGAYLLLLAQVLKPALLIAYRDYVNQADDLTDGTIQRSLDLAISEKTIQIRELLELADEELGAHQQDKVTANRWVAAFQSRLDEVGGLSLEKPKQSDTMMILEDSRTFQLAEIPARDKTFALCHYYWPDIIDPTFAYGEGVNLQLRSAVSHLNEVWAVEVGGAILHAFADDLDWEFIRDAARWTFDESRHVRMGFERLCTWGFEPGEMPLGSYIYDSAYGQDPIVRMGMLHYFETKNIGKKVTRAQAFAAYADGMSQHDMEFDWADEAIHANYGRHWHTVLREQYPDRIPEMQQLHEYCDELVAIEVAKATKTEKLQIKEIANAMLAKTLLQH
ncbi:MAG: DUF455 family protein [Deinococcales bacterium]|nr:DUF455 family protein [Deinococcales bacterium]